MAPNMGRSSISASSASYISELSTGNKREPYPKSDISVNLKDHYSSKVYTSSSPISGDVTITTRRPVRFDSVQIVLLGHTKTIFEGISLPQDVTHTFLKMVMPIPESSYPVPRILEPGRTYTIPFNFVIPNQLTINACNHPMLSDQLQDHHVLLPPSLGGWQRDDMAPRMVQVEYIIKARVLREDDLGGRKARVMEATQTIQVLPATPEQPPLNITDKDKLYTMSKTKTLRKNILSTKLGRLTAVADQPNPAVLSADGRRVMSHPTARVRLTFEPESPRTLPPQITAVSGKVTAHTYFSSGTISSFPNLGEWNPPYLADRRGQFFTSVGLPTFQLAEQPAWTPAPTVIVRRDSGYCSSSSNSDSSDRELEVPSSKQKKNNNNNNNNKKKKKTNRLSTSSTPTETTTTTQSPLYHTTVLDIPFSLPTDKKMFVPTFHSCIASRVYTLQLSLGLSTRGAAGTLTLTVPLQVAVEEGHDARERGGLSALVDAPGLPSFEEVAADEHLRPRLLQVPGGQGFVEGGSVSLLPGAWDLTEGLAPESVPVSVGDALPTYGEPGYRRRLD
ncbi:hypothetical protein VTK56DRAFT_4012 [Thermocarpiscus australiensis]